MYLLCTENGSCADLPNTIDEVMRLGEGRLWLRLFVRVAGAFAACDSFDKASIPIGLNSADPLLEWGVGGK